MSGNFSGGSFSGAVGGFSVDAAPTPTAPTNPVYSGGATYGRRYKPWQTKAEELAERIALGILPARVEAAAEAVEAAVEAQARMSVPQVLSDVDLTAETAKAEAARALYFEVYREYMAAEAILEQWRADMAEHKTRIIHAAAALLLLN